MDFKVEKGIKIPQPRVRTDYPLQTLLPNESFFVPDGTAGRAGKKLAQSVGAVALAVRRESNKTKRFVVRRVVEGGQTGVRVWRTE